MLLGAIRTRLKPGARPERQNGGVMEDTVLVHEWGSDAFHRHVLELESRGYTTQEGTYQITAEMNPETGEIIHLHTIEMIREDPA